MFRLYFIVLLLGPTFLLGQFETPYEKSGKKATASYAECRDWYRAIQIANPEITYFDSMGESDGGFPIFVFRIYTRENASPVKALIINNIHPGEPEGTDASMLLVKDLLSNSKEWKAVLQNIDLHIICQYNVDGTLNTGTKFRANQNGPEIQGFRGNAKNLDLNRDFIKCDSRNARAFVQYFSENKFHILVDNHTSNGSDYQYTLTWFHTREQKLHDKLAPIVLELSRDLKDCLLKNEIPTAPYVETIKNTPDSGIVAFWESGRYSTGYAALNHCIGFTVETHMFKPFVERVNVTRSFMEMLLKLLADEKTSENIVKTYNQIAQNPRFDYNGRMEKIDWELNTSKADTIEFLGYEFGYKKSEISGQQRLYYDRNKPWKKNIPYYRYYTAIDSIKMPRMYIVPHAWEEVIQRLRLNGIAANYIGKDTMWPVRASYIITYETVKSPYEGHYMHFNTATKDTITKIQVYKGDYYVKVNASNQKFLAAVLEPRSADSYFNWNFFDGILMQKEWFSDYVFEEKAVELLKSDSILNAGFEFEKTHDLEFAKNHGAQLAWIYYHSPYYEKTHKRYPVYRVD